MGAPLRMRYQPSRRRGSAGGVRTALPEFRIFYAARLTPWAAWTVQATDPDGDPVAYSIVSGDPGGLFAIEAATGELSYRGAGEDYESETTSYELTVRASDGSLHSDVTVNVTDVAEAPAFGQHSYAFDLAENADGATLGLSLGRVGDGRDRIRWRPRLVCGRARAGRVYRVDLEGSWTEAGTLADTCLRGIHDTDGVLLAGTTDENDGYILNSRMTFTADHNGLRTASAGRSALVDDNRQGWPCRRRSSRPIWIALRAQGGRHA